MSSSASAFRPPSAEVVRLEQDAKRERNWKRWGPYLSERQWGTVREDYSADGSCWQYFSHDQSRSRAYRWGEDGLLGFTDRECRLCFALALWNGQDPILKERLFGLTGPEGNHGEDVKECYYYLDSTPTHTYMKALYKYPQRAYPYNQLVEENRRRGKHEPEFELEDTGVFDEGRYFDVFAEYAKASPNDTLIKITVANRGPEAATIHLLPTLWYRNTWTWGCTHEGCEVKSVIDRVKGSNATVVTDHPTLGRFRFDVEPVKGAGKGGTPELLFTENETNTKRLWNYGAPGRYYKDAFHEYVVSGKKEAVNPKGFGSKMAAYHKLDVPAGGQVVVRCRLSMLAEATRHSADEATAPRTNGPATAADADAKTGEAPAEPFGPEFDETFAKRVEECDDFYDLKIPPALTAQQKLVARQAYAGLLWSKQFYHYIVDAWLKGDPSMPPPPEGRWRNARNREWAQHLYNRDVISMPDKWEYPWYAAWDLAFHMIPFARIDPYFAKEQLLLMLREWYMHPNGQLPAYEFAFGDVNPPVHAWAVWRVYKMTGPKGSRDRLFLARAFQKLLINFTWWVNRKDVDGKNVFGGGFLGLDNIGVFDRSRPLPGGGHLQQADGTAWMAFFCSTMLNMALELASDNPEYEDVASKFFEHFVAIADAINTLGGTGLWNEQDGFYYDQLSINGQNTALCVRSMVGIIPLFTCDVLEDEIVDRLPGFKKRMQWFLDHREDLSRHISLNVSSDDEDNLHLHRMLALPSKERLQRVLKYVLDETEFLSPYGVRSLSKYHERCPYTLQCQGETYGVEYAPGESTTHMFGGNSNWRGPIWFPVNYILVEVLERYHFFYGESLKVEYPTGSGRLMNLKDVAYELMKRLTGLFLPDATGKRPIHGDDRRYAEDPHWRDLVLFYEYFHGDTGRGVGASHQTGWTGLVADLLHKLGTRAGATTTPAKPPEKPADKSPAGPKRKLTGAKA